VLGTGRATTALSIRVVVSLTNLESFMHILTISQVQKARGEREIAEGVVGLAGHSRGDEADGL
jgi:hypothetical protein